MSRTCEERTCVARRLVAEYRDALNKISGEVTGDELTGSIQDLCNEIDKKANDSSGLVHAVAVELDEFYRRIIGETYSRSDLMIYLNQQKNDIQDRHQAVLIYPELFHKAHDVIHHYLCQDRA